MKEWSVPIVMIVNKTSLIFLSAIFLIAFSFSNAKAENIVPSLYDVQDISVNFARFGNETASNDCGVYKRYVSEQTLIALKKDGLPARGSMENPPKGKVSVELIPEVVTITLNNKRCLSWISFSVQSRNAIKIAPADYHREVKLNYWHAGLLISTYINAHKRGMGEAINKLSGKFLMQYNLDQPPNLKIK